MSKWVQIPIKELPPRNIKILAVHYLTRWDEYAVKRRDTKRGKLWGELLKSEER